MYFQDELRIFFDEIVVSMLIYCCCCCIIVLHPRSTSKVMSGRSVNILTTLFLGRLRPPKQLTSTSCTYFRQ